ncbi:MAG: hypothetical protein ACI31F_01650 [Muribaculaceae bacterium]
MINYISTLLSAILLLAASCSSTQVTDERLLAVENIMDARPDSALQLLQNIDKSKLSTDYDKAMFALLYSQALDKNYIDLENDSIISLATKYFEKIEDTYHLSLASFYHGRVLMNAKKYAEAACYMLQAFENAEVNEEYFWMGRAYEYLAMIYDSNFYGTEAVEYMKKGFEFMQKSGRQTYVNYSLLELMRIQQNNRKYDDCIATGYLLLDSAATFNDTILAENTKALLGNAYFCKKNYKKAAEYFEEISGTESFIDSRRCLLGISYLYLNEANKAEKLINDSLRNSDVFNPFFINYHKRRSEFEQAYICLDREYNLLAKELDRIEKQNFANKLDTFRKVQKEKLDAKIENEKSKRGILQWSILGLIILMTAAIYYFYKRKIKIVEDNVAIANNIEDVLSLKKSDINQSDEFRKIFESRIEIINKLCKSLVKIDDSEIKDKISQELQKIIVSFSPKGKAFREIEDYINANCNSLLAKFKKDFPKIRKEDYAIFVYSIIGLNSAAILLFLGEDKYENIYNRKYRLKTKISSIMTEGHEIFTKYL